MDKFDVVTKLVGSMDPSTWITSRGVSAWLLVALLFCVYVLWRDGARAGALSLMRYVMVWLTLAGTAFLIY